MPSVGPLEIGIVLIVALLVFGPKRLPEFGGSLGKGIRDFGKGLKGDDDDSREQLTSETAENTQEKVG